MGPVDILENYVHFERNKTSPRFSKREQRKRNHKSPFETCVWRQSEETGFVVYRLCQERNLFSSMVTELKRMNILRSWVLRFKDEEERRDVATREKSGKFYLLKRETVFETRRNRGLSV